MHVQVIHIIILVCSKILQRVFNPISGQCTVLQWQFSRKWPCRKTLQRTDFSTLFSLTTFKDKGSWIFSSCSFIIYCNLWYLGSSYSRYLCYNNISYILIRYLVIYFRFSYYLLGPLYSIYIIKLFTPNKLNVLTNIGYNTLSRL